MINGRRHHHSSSSLHSKKSLTRTGIGDGLNQSSFSAGRNPRAGLITERQRNCRQGGLKEHYISHSDKLGYLGSGEMPVSLQGKPCVTRHPVSTSITDMNGDV